MSQNLVGKIELYKPEPAPKPGCLEIAGTIIGAAVFVGFILMTYWR